MVIFWDDNTIVLNTAFLDFFLHYFQFIYDYRILYKLFYRRWRFLGQVIFYGIIIESTTKLV